MGVGFLPDLQRMLARIRPGIGDHDPADSNHGVHCNNRSRTLAVDHQTSNAPTRRTDENMKQNEIKEIRGENGQRMALAEDLNTHIAQRSKFPAFVVTYWLRTLQEETLRKLGEQAIKLLMKTDVKDDDTLHEFHAIVALAVQGETRNPGLQLNLTMYGSYIQNMLAAIAVEVCRRKNWLKAPTPPGVFKNTTVELELTALGQQRYVQDEDRIADLVMRHLVGQAKS